MFVGHFLPFWDPQIEIWFLLLSETPQFGKRPHFWQIFCSQWVQVSQLSWYWHFHLSGIVWLCALTLYMSISCHVPASFFLVVQVGFGFSENRRSNYWDMQHRAHGVKSIKSQSKSPILIQNSSLTPHSSMALYNGLHLLLALPPVSRLSTM